MKNRRYCLMIKMDGEMLAMAQAISRHFNIRNPRRRDDDSVNVAEVIRIIVYYFVRRNRIKCAFNSTLIPENMRSMLDRLDYDFNPATTGQYIDNGNIVQVRVTSEFHRAASMLSALMSVSMSDIARVPILAMYREINKEDAK